MIKNVKAPVDWRASLCLIKYVQCITICMMVGSPFNKYLAVKKVHVTVN